MKSKAVIIALAACVGITVFVIICFGLQVKKVANAQSIVSVYSARNSAVSNSTITVHSLFGDKKHFHFSTYVTSVRKIDCSRCPSDFQSAWLTYVQTCERLEQYKPADALGDALQSIGLAHGDASGFTAANNRMEKRDPTEANFALEKIALSYGVTLH